MITIVEANLHDQAHVTAVIELTSQLAASESGRRKAMTSEERDLLLPTLRRHASKYVLLAEADGILCGLALCFVQLATFSGRETLKVHDLFVTGKYRGQGTGKALVEAAVRHAREMNYAFVTVEVSIANSVANRLYEVLNFDDWITPTKFLELRL